MAEDEKYSEFVEKFKPKLTTDDCYTPPLVYEAVKDWACEEYGISPDSIVRPLLLLSDKKAAEKAAAEKAAAEKKDVIVWELSDRERDIINRLNQTQLKRKRR